MKSLTVSILVSLLAITACNNNGQGPDAWGNFETTEITISAESGGRILFIDAPEGKIIPQNAVIAVIDTMMLHLQKKEAAAAKGSVKSKSAAIESQNAILRQQIDNLNINIARTENMIAGQAATQKQLDDLTGQRAVLEKQIGANKTQAAAIASELVVLEAKTALLNEQISRCTVKAPSEGTVLARYFEAGEITSPGRPLIKMADMKVMKLKVFVSGSMLGNVVIGEPCKVMVDEGEKGYRNYTGTITTVSDNAEFTPKIIQTKDERVNLVYAVTIEVANDGFLKSGMPGEAIFTVKGNS
jgi:HlyD family secretion protein